MKGPTLYQGEIITKYLKYIGKIKKSSSPEPLGLFHPNLAQCILGCRGFKFIQMKVPALFQWEIITILQKYIDQFKKLCFSRTTGPISTKLGTTHPWVKGIQVCSKEGAPPLITKFRKYIYEIKNNHLQNHGANFKQTWHKASLGEGNSNVFK